MIGQTLAHFKIVEKIGEGGMGVVYRALDTRLDRAVAIKVLHAGALGDSVKKRRFLQEARAAASLNHSNVASIYEVGDAGEVEFIAMEYVAGERLDTRIREGPLHPTQVAEIGLQIADALQEAHSHGITHRDIKPANLMVTSRGQVKVLDFGLAKLSAHIREERREAPATELSTQAETVAGTVAGTVPYMSPEQAVGHEVDHRSDIFSLGVVLYELSTGSRPFSGDTTIETIDRILHYEPKFVENGVPAELAPIVRRCLEKDRERRYETAEQLIRDLREIVSPATMTVRATGTPADSLVASHARLFVFSAVAITVGVLVTTIALPRRASAIDSLVVVPFANASGDPQMEYLGDGIAESLTNNLSQAPGLRVVSRSSAFVFKGKTTDLSAIRRALRVRAVVTGRIRQRNEKVNVQAELLDTRDGSQLWGEQYDRRKGEIFAIQEEIAEDISAKLRLRFNRDDKNRFTRTTNSVEAYQLYLRGRFFSNTYTTEGFTKGIEYLNQAIAADPGYALAYAGLAASYYDASGTFIIPGEAMPKAKAAAMTALKLDDTLAEAHTTLGCVEAFYEWSWAEGKKEFDRAISLNPGHGQSHQYYGIYLLYQGMFDQAITELTRAHELDPLTPIVSTNLGWAYFLARRHEEAIREVQEVVRMRPDFPVARYTLGLIYEENGMFSEARHELERAKALDSDSPYPLAFLAHLWAKSGRHAEARKALIELHEALPRRYISPYFFGLIYAALGDTDQAFACLEKAFAERSEDLLFVKGDPRADPLRRDPRLANLVARMGLPP